METNKEEFDENDRKYHRIGDELLVEYYKEQNVITDEEERNPNPLLNPNSVCLKQAQLEILSCDDLLEQNKALLVEFLFNVWSEQNKALLEQLPFDDLSEQNKALLAQLPFDVHLDSDVAQLCNELLNEILEEKKRKGEKRLHILTSHQKHDPLTLKFIISRQIRVIVYI